MGLAIQTKSDKKTNYNSWVLNSVPLLLVNLHPFTILNAPHSFQALTKTQSSTCFICVVFLSLSSLLSSGITQAFDSDLGSFPCMFCDLHIPRALLFSLITTLPSLRFHTMILHYLPCPKLFNPDFVSELQWKYLLKFLIWTNPRASPTFVWSNTEAHIVVLLKTQFPVPQKQNKP